MRNTKTLAALLGTLLSLTLALKVSAFEMAKDAALRACQKVSSFERSNCFNFVSQSQIVDLQAAQACHQMSFSSNIMACLNAINAKIYSPSEIQICLEESFDSHKISCLQNTGRMAFAPTAVPVIPQATEIIISAPPTTTACIDLSRKNRLMVWAREVEQKITDQMPRQALQALQRLKQEISTL